MIKQRLVPLKLIPLGVYLCLSRGHDLVAASATNGLRRDRSLTALSNSSRFIIPMAVPLKLCPDTYCPDLFKNRTDTRTGAGHPGQQNQEVRDRQAGHLQDTPDSPQRSAC
jgi:hypothetical protein